MKSHKEVLARIIEEMTLVGDDLVEARRPILELLREINEKPYGDDSLTGVVALLQDVAKEALNIQQLFLKETPEIDKMGRIAKFGGLAKGAKFIFFPVDGDNSGHGGYLGQHFIYIKLATELSSGENAVAEHSGNLSTMPQGMWVLEVK